MASPSCDAQRLRNCANFGEYCRELISVNQTRDAALLCISQSHAYNQAYLDFLLEQDQSFAELKLWFNYVQSARVELMAEAGSMEYNNDADILNKNVATNLFKESISDLPFAVKQNEMAYSIAQQQAVAQAQMATTLHEGQ